MELVRDHLEVTASGPHLGHFQLGIEAANYSLAMELLIDLYTDPIGSVVRELTSNALDANRASGKGDIPIEVTLPSPLSPTLIIKDRGKGMTKEFLMTTYCSLLSSTKRDDNDDIGGYGIGSKSPLGYTDSYALSTRVGGQELHVHVSRNGGFHLMGANPTTEEDGTTVMVQVRTADCPAFAQATSWLRYMKPAPLINGVPIPEEKSLLEGDGWSIADSDKLDHKLQVLLGPIPYYLDKSKLGNYSREVGCVLNALGVRLHFPIGALSVTPSRETLRYNEDTIATLTETLNKVYVPMREAIGALLDSHEFMVDSIALSRKYKFFDWKPPSAKPGRNYANSTVTFPTSETWVSYAYNSYSKDNITRQEITQYSFYNYNQVEVYVGDKDVVRRVRAYLRAKKSHDIVILVGPIGSVVSEQGIMSIHPTTNLPEYNSYDVDEEEVDKGSTPTPKKVLPQLGKGHMRARVWDTSSLTGGTLLYAYTKEATLPLDGEGHYLIMYRGKVVHPELTSKSEFGYTEIKTLIAAIKEEGSLYIVLPDQVHRLGPGWKEAISTLHEKVAPHLPWIKQVNSLGLTLPLMMSGETSKYYERVGLGDSYFCEFLKLVEETERLRRGTHSKLCALYHYLPTIWDAVPALATRDNDPVLNLWSLVGTIYPILNKGSFPKDLVVEYIRRVEADHKREWGLYGACKLTTYAKRATMTGRELMIDYYGGHADVTGYYRDFE